MTEQTKEKKTTFRTKDLNLAAFLWCQPGVRLAKLDSQRGQGNTIFFAFDLDMTEVELQKLQIDYANGDTMIEPTAFTKQQNQLRDLLHSSKGSSKRGS